MILNMKNDTVEYKTPQYFATKNLVCIDLSYYYLIKYYSSGENHKAKMKFIS